MSSPPALTTPSASAEDTLIPLILAAHPGIKLDYKKMSALDGIKTASSLEHRFRKYRARGQEILVAKGADAGAGGIPEGLVPVTPKKKRVTKDVGEGGEGADGEETPKKKARTPKTPKTPKNPKVPTPKTPKTLKVPKVPKVGKGGKGKVVTEANDEKEAGDGGDGDALQAAHGEDIEDEGEEVKQEMSFEFEGSQL